MNGHLMEILARQIVAELPEPKRLLYQYIVQVEDSLAEQSTTSDQFMTLLVKHSPHQQAAEHFNRSFEKTIMMMRDIEKEIDEQLNEKLRQAQWIDCTDEVQGKSKLYKEKVAYFHFVI